MISSVYIQILYVYCIFMYDCFQNYPLHIYLCVCKYDICTNCMCVHKKWYA